MNTACHAQVVSAYSICGGSTSVLCGQLIVVIVRACVCMNRSVGKETDWALAAIVVISNSCPLPIQPFIQTCLHCATRPFPEDPHWERAREAIEHRRVGERERETPPYVIHFFQSLSPSVPPTLAVLLRADVSYHTAQRYVSAHTHAHTRVQTNTHTYHNSQRYVHFISLFQRPVGSFHAY